MSNRIRALEDALAIMHGTTSAERHPLLSDDLLKIKFGAEALRSDNTQKPNGQGGDGGGIANGYKSDQSGQEATVKTEEQENIDALGTLTLDDKSGEVKYFGRSAGIPRLVTDVDDRRTRNGPHHLRKMVMNSTTRTSTMQRIYSLHSTPPRLHPRTPRLLHQQAQVQHRRRPAFRRFHVSQTYSRLHRPSRHRLHLPLEDLSPPRYRPEAIRTPNLLDLLYAYLPAYPRAHELSESYLQHATYFFRPIKRDELLGESTTLPGMSIDSQETAPIPPAFLKQVYDAASKRQLRQLHTYYADAGSPGSSNGDGAEENSPTYSQLQTPLTPFAIPPYTFPQQGQQGAAGTSTPAAHPTLDPDPDPSAPHSLATIFMILALGALLDINKPPYNAEAERYYTLGLLFCLLSE
ncbi:zinc cluster transcription factor [Salix suchowensis]|nr:zinc cluster transcription factor [Salix suchowensis]